jgi:hypothetical protein
MPIQQGEPTVLEPVTPAPECRAFDETRNMHLPPRRLRSLAFVFGVEQQAGSAEPPASGAGPQEAPGNVDAGKPDRDDADGDDPERQPTP